MRYVYHMTVETEMDITGKKYKAYGIKVTDGNGGVITIVPDVFTDMQKADEFIRIFNSAELSVIHLFEVLDDILAN